jgi:hypothetical protein
MTVITTITGSSSPFIFMFAEEVCSSWEQHSQLIERCLVPGSLQGGSDQASCRTILLEQSPVCCVHLLLSELFAMNACLFAACPALLGGGSGLITRQGVLHGFLSLCCHMNRHCVSMCATNVLHMSWGSYSRW